MRLLAAMMGLLVLAGWSGARAQAAVGFQAAGGIQTAVGFETVDVPVAGAAAIPVDIWYPTSSPAAMLDLGLFEQVVAARGAVQGMGLRLIVVSHGNGGTRDEHYDTALALAHAGFVVAALEHTGDNYRDQSRATDIANRPREIHRLIDYMLTEWPAHAQLSAAGVGAFGYSSGGFTVLAAAGGEPDRTLIAPHCAAHPRFYDCGLIAAHPPDMTAPPVFVHDPRIKALVVAAPALGFTFAHGLKGVTQPVQLWRADDDRVLPAPEYADAVRSALPRPPEFHGVPNADHFDFLAPCSAALAQVAPSVCVSRAGFDRAAFHRTFNAAVVGFFQAQLK